MTLRDHRRTLGVSDTADAQEIKAAFKTLAKRYHPDTNGDNPDAEKKFKEINAAYQALKAAGEAGYGSRPGASGSGNGDFSFDESGIFDDIFSMMRERMHWQDGYASDTGFGFDFDGETFTRKGPKRTGTAVRGADVEDTVEITLEQAYTGAHVIIPVRNDERVRVKVPEGVLDGAQLRIRGHGEKGRNGGEDGDLIVTLRVAEHRVFSLDGTNLRIRFDVPFTTAAIGGTIRFEHLDGQKHAVDVPPFHKGETTLVAKGCGWPAKDPSANGHLLIDLKAVIPTNLTDRQRRLLADFEKTAPEYRSDRLANTFGF
jgi:DnaJ-class molecular chaperone